MLHRLPMALAASLALVGLTLHPAQADPISGAEARDQLYPADRVEVVRHDVQRLAAEEVQILAAVAQTQKYYAAVAFAPSLGLMSEATVMAANHHSVDAARTAALAECGARASGVGACVIAMEVRPAGWEARALQLSSDATEAFDRDFATGRGPRALAISTSTGLWGLGQGADAGAEALSACQGTSDAGDCAVAIID